MRLNRRFLKFLSYYKPFKGLLAADLFFAFVASLAVLGFPMLVSQVTARAISPSGVDAATLATIAGAFILLMAAEYGSNYFISYYGHVMGAKMEFNIRNDLFAHYQKLSFSFYDNQKTGQLMSRITNDLFDVTELAHHGPEDVLISIVKIIGSFVILMTINIPLTLTIFAILPFMALFSVHYNKKMRRAFKRNRERIADINTQIEDSLSGVRVVRSFANEGLEMDNFREGNSRFVESKKDSYYNMAKFHSGLSAFASFITIALVITGAAFISGDRLDLPGLIAYLLYINTLIEPIRRFMNFTEQFQNGATGFVRFMEIMETEPDITDSESASDVGRVDGAVTFSHVSFKYSSELDYVLKDISIYINRGEYVALVGSSGVGKTTLCSLIPRFYEATGGKILIDGKELSEFTLRSLRRHIGVVQQDVYLFIGTVKENIRYGKPDASDEEIVEAAKNANAHEFIKELPGGYDAYIGQRGIKLSGGQKQRISIARVFLKNPAILIFDEATSSLDNESEKVVQDSFERLARDRTTFVIAHRLSTIRNAGRIIVLNEDGVAEEGSHGELLEADGVYARFYRMQFF